MMARHAMSLPGSALGIDPSGVGFPRRVRANHFA